MDARQALRQYLEQRKELGESEFLLDSLSVGDAMRVLGAREDERTGRREDEKTQVRGPGSEVRGALVPPTPVIRDKAPAASDDWRATLRAAGAAPGEPVAPPKQSIPRNAFPPPDAPGATAPTPSIIGDAPAGLVVGTASRELFGGPLSHVASLDELRAVIKSCRSCGLHATATNPVPGEGNPNADLVCVGEAPGQTEDETGKPFVGAAGQLLTRILEGGMQIPRDNVFICNVLKHRPPGNRNPAPDEIVACRPYLMRQLELLRPKVILALGTFAAQTLLETKLAIGKLRGQVHSFYGIPLVVTYHPAALLRNPNWKRPTYEDVKLARRLLDRTHDGA